MKEQTNRLIAKLFDIGKAIQPNGADPLAHPFACFPAQIDIVARMVAFPGMAVERTGYMHA